MEEGSKINIIPTAAANSESMGWDLLKEIGAKFDANGNGKMSNSDMKELLLQFPVSTEEEVDRVVTEMDGDGDGVIRFVQFIDFLRKEEIRHPIKCFARSISEVLSLNIVRFCLPKVYAVEEGFSPFQTVDYLSIPLEYKSTAIGGGKYMEEKLEKAFACFDTDGDGKISAIEVKSVLSSLGRVISLEEAQRITTEIDKDGDGLADLKDLTGFLRKDVRIDVEGSFAFDTIPEAYRYAKWMKEPEMAIAYPAEPIYIPGGTWWDAKAAADDYEKWMKEPEMAIAYPTEPVHNRGGTWWEAKAAAAAKVLAKFAAAGCAAAFLTLLASDLPRDYAWIAIGVTLVIPLCAVSLA